MIILLLCIHVLTLVVCICCYLVLEQKIKENKYYIKSLNEYDESHSGKLAQYGYSIDDLKQRILDLEISKYRQHQVIEMLINYLKIEEKHEDAKIYFVKRGNHVDKNRRLVS